MAVMKRFRKCKLTNKKSTFYEAQVYVRGQRIAVKTFSSRAHAEIWHDDTKKEYLNSEFVVSSEDLFSDCLNAYMNEAVGKLKESSLQSRMTRLYLFTTSPLMTVKMSDFNGKIVDQWINWLLVHPTRQNPGRKSFIHELKYLGVILNWYRNYKDASFVVPITKKHRERIYYKNLASRRPDYFMKPGEVLKWLDWLKDHRSDPVYHRLATFLVLTGVRVGEAAGLLWDCVDLETGCIRIVRTVIWDQNSKTPTLTNSTKTEDSVRVIPIPKELISLLRQMSLEKNNCSLTPSPVFDNKEGNLLRYNAIQSAFNKGFVALGLPWRSTHICRHTHATMMLLATGSLSAVQANLGHRSQKITERYAKAVAALRQDDADKTARFLFQNFHQSQMKSQINQFVR